MTPAWSWYVILLVVSNIAGCVWLLWWTGRRKAGDPAPTDLSHVWDGNLSEYNKPMPRWWINLFYLTIVFAIGYLIYYPGLGAFAGTSGWTSGKEHAAAKASSDAKLDIAYRPFAGKPIDVLARDPHALNLGRSLFNHNCVTCHGSSGKGAIGYPNLTDDIWHWGGSPEQILQSVLDGREGVMPAWGTVLKGMGGEFAVDHVLAYVETLSPKGKKSQHNDYMVARGKPLYDGLCAACHGATGTGNQQLGIPDLTDDYWLYGNSAASLVQTVSEGRHGVMPAHRELLGETRSRLAAAYEWSLSHPATVPAP